MSTGDQITVFVCGPTLSGEVLSHITVRDGALVWEGGDEPAPQPREEIRARHYLPVQGGLVLLETEAGLYLAAADDFQYHKTFSESNKSP